MLSEKGLSSTQITDYVQAISQSIIKGEVALFCGAGISHNSGLPLANELKQSILKELHISKVETEEIESSNLPFEAFMETVSESQNISEILDVFKTGKPNTNHILIAKLARNGHIRAIFTTNFDLFLEKALKQEGLKEDFDFRVFYDEEQFSTISFSNLDNGIINIFKIHGSAEDNRSIRTTLMEIARKSLSEKRMNLIRHLFSTGNHKIVLVLGYSCSDVFDITPQIQSISRNQKEIILIEHASSMKIESIGAKRAKNPFAKFNGVRLVCDTDKFIKKLWGFLKPQIGEYVCLKQVERWSPIIEEWGKAFDENKGCSRYFLLGSLFNEISSFRNALKYFNATLDVDKEINDEQGQAACYGSLGNVNHSLGEFDKAITNYRISLKIAKRIGDLVKQASSYTNLGTVYFDLGDFNKAIECHKNALEIDRSVGDRGGEAADLAGLGNAFHSLGDFEKAIEYHKKSLEITEQLGAKKGETTCQTNLGNVYRDLGEFDKALEHHKKSLEIAKQIGDKVMEARYYTNVGIIRFDQGNFRKAICCHKKSLQIAEQIEDKVMEANCLINLGDVYHGLGEIKKAANCYTKSQSTLERIGQSHLLEIAGNRLLAVSKEKNRTRA
jgi:tetratricopeptide (TPR) repeat protein